MLQGEEKRKRSKIGLLDRAQKIEDEVAEKMSQEARKCVTREHLCVAELIY